MDNNLSQIVGGHSEAINTLKNEVHAMRGDLAEIKELLATSKGGVRMLIAVGGVAMSCGAGFVALFHWLQGLHS